MKMEIRHELTSVSLFVLQTTTMLQLCYAKTKTIETHYRNQILSNMLNKIDKGNAHYLRVSRSWTFPSMNILGFFAIVTLEGQIGEGLCFRSSFGKKGQRGRSLLWRRPVRWWFQGKIETGLQQETREENNLGKEIGVQFINA